MRAPLPVRRILPLAASLLLWGPVAAFADVAMTMANGKVTIVARGATPRQILVEWARLGQTRIVNLDRVPGGPDTFELRDVPEAKALAIVLRAAAGYIAAPRPMGVPGASLYDRIMIMPASIASAAPMAMPMRQAQGGQMPVFESAPDPTGLANEEPVDIAGTPVFPGSDGNPPVVTPGQMPQLPAQFQNGLPPSVVPGEGPPTNTTTTPTPATTPGAGQFVAPLPGVLPGPAQPPQPKP